MTVKKWKHSGTKKHSMSDREIRNGLLSEKAAEEGIVLLKNDKKILPLNISTKIGLYGAGAGKTVKGGTGSGDVNNRSNISIYQGLKENGIQGRKPYLTQYMGMNPEEVRVLPYADCLQLKKGDRFLICSDGVSDMVSIEFLETMLLQTQSPAKCVNTILTAALEAGGKDNITAIVLEINR